MILPTDNECVCVLSTTKGKELRQNVNVLAEFASEANLLVSTSGPGVGSVDAYTVDSDVSLSLVSMTSVFFEQNFYIHPNAIKPSSTLYHPCLNQYICKSLASLSSLKLQGINHTTASAAVRIPIVCLHLQNSLRSIVDKDIITFRILWNDPLNLHLNIHNTESGTSTNHLLHLLRVRRVFIHRSIPPFPIAHIIRAQPLRNAATTLANVGHDYFYVGFDASGLQLFALRSNHVTTFIVPTIINAPTTHQNRMFKLIAGPFKLAPMLMFIKHRLCNHYVLYVTNRTLAIEGSSAALESIQPIAGHPSNRLLMLIRSAPLEGHRLEEFKGLIDKAVNTFEWKDSIADLILSTTTTNPSDGVGDSYGDQHTISLHSLYSSVHPCNVYRDVSFAPVINTSKPVANNDSTISHGSLYQNTSMAYHSQSTLFAASQHVSIETKLKMAAASEREGGNRSKIQLAVPTASWVTFGEDEDISRLFRLSEDSTDYDHGGINNSNESFGNVNDAMDSGPNETIMSPNSQEIAVDIEMEDQELDDDGNMWD